MIHVSGKQMNYFWCLILSNYGTMLSFCNWRTITEMNYSPLEIQSNWYSNAKLKTEWPKRFHHIITMLRFVTNLGRGAEWSQSYLLQSLFFTHVVLIHQIFHSFGFGTVSWMYDEFSITFSLQYWICCDYFQYWCDLPIYQWTVY